MTSPLPRFATRPNPDRPSFGRHVATVAAALGTPLLPWQRLVADIAFEVDERGRYAYPLVVVSVPRQSGKTTLVLSNAVHRCLSRPDGRARA